VFAGVLIDFEPRLPDRAGIAVSRIPQSASGVGWTGLRRATWRAKEFVQTQYTIDLPSVCGIGISMGRRTTFTGPERRYT